MAGRRVTVIGDLMLDRFLWGKVSRISPEAPVPVVEVTRQTRAPGGAGNVVMNLLALGADVQVVSVLGTDAGGDELLSTLEGPRVDISGILRDPARPTTVKTRVLAHNQQMLRVDHEVKAPVPRSMQEDLARNLERSLSRSDAAVLSDYGKGVVTPFVLKTAIRQARKRGIPLTVDPKTEHFKLYKGVTCVTPNAQEAWTGMLMHPKDGQEAMEELGRRILRALRTQAVLITQGPEGMTLLENHSPVRIRHIPTAAKEVFDVTGAGDTVIAAFTLALASGADFHQAALVANKAAGVVVGKLGTATCSLEELAK